MDSLPPRQRQVLDFVTGYIRRRKQSPSIREIADHLGVSGNLGVLKHLDALERKGFLRRENCHRGIFLSETHFADNATALPLVGIVAAGKPVEAFNLSDVMEVPSSMTGPGNVVYEVRGDSMIEEGIMHGDYIVVHPQPVAQNGQPVIAEVNGAITVKFFYGRSDHVELRPANSAMAPIIVGKEDDFRILGIVVGSMRLYRQGWKEK